MNDRHHPVAAPLALAALLAALPARAGEFSAGFLNWNQDVTGSAVTDSDTLDLEQDLGVQSRERNLFLLAWDTGPGWPDLAASYARIRADGLQEGTPGLLPPLLPGIPDAEVQADLRDVQLSLRYPLWRGDHASLALGLSAKQLQGDILVRDENDAGADHERIDEIFPLAHLRLQADAAAWLRLSAQGNYVEYQGDRAYDWALQVQLRWGALALEAGWMSKGYRVNTDSYRLDARFAGPMLGASLLLP